MRARQIVTVTGITTALYVLSPTARADLMEFTDKTEWEAAIDDFTTIGFTEYPEFTHLTDEYADQGVVFTQGIVEVGHGRSLFPNDGWGIQGIGDIRLTFNTPQSWFAVDYAGGIKFDLYSNGVLTARSSDFGGSGIGFFAGIVSDTPFDELVFYDWLGDDATAIDDMHFGAVPAPGAIGFAVLALMIPRRSRR